MPITGEMIISGFVSKVVNDCGDILKNKIKEADKNRKSDEKNMETRIYQVLVDALNRFSYNEHKKEEIVYDAAESMLKQFKNGKDDYKEAVRAGLKIVVSEVNDNVCKRFFEALCYEICQKENRDLAIEVIILQQEQTNGYIQEGFRKSYVNNEEINRKLDYLLKELIDKKAHKEQCNSENFIENRADEYDQKWNDYVFLNKFDEEDENVGTEIKLWEIYKEECLPRYIWKKNSLPSESSIRDLLKKYIIYKQNRKMLLILGQPGIGKSTLITWIMANLVKKKDDILVYQFANDLGSINWQGDNVLNDIFKVIDLKYDELVNKTLILDGFDEIYAGGDRERILNKLNQELKRRNILKNFSLIITCRQNYIYNLQNIECDYITLQVWNEEQIDIFCRAYWEKCGSEISEDKMQKILENKEIFGIPLILYMILALDITIEKSNSIVDVYDQIFSLKKGGIYDRCYDLKHRINEPNVKKYIHHISQKIAFWIFENNNDRAFILQKKFKKICENEKCKAEKEGDEIESNTLIGGYFKIKHCEGKLADEVNFVHRSIYEYFVALYFFESINYLTSKEEVAGKLGELLKKGRLSKQMLEFIKYKFNSMGVYDLSNNIKEAFNIMLRDGMTYYVKKKYKNIIAQEMNIFSNMLEIVYLCNLRFEKYNNIVFYLVHNHFNPLNLCEIYLRGAKLNGADLIGADLNGADLIGADLCRAYLFRTKLNKAKLNEAKLIRADLRQAKLNGASLNEADLNGADLIGADLREANLNETIFDERQVNMLHEKYDLSMSRVVLSETDEVISYQEYCLRKQKG